MAQVWTAGTVRQLRIGRRQTQDELAQSLGIDRMTVARWEEGKSNPGIRNMIKLDNLASEEAGR